MADDLVSERLTQLENAVRKAGDALAHLREENAQLGADIKRLGDENAQLRREAAKFTQERQQVIAQIDTLLKDIGKLGLE